MYWGGWDPDGEIASYEYIVTDNPTGVFNPTDTVGVDWVPVTGNHSTFAFSADQPVDTLDTTNSVAVFTRSHTFFIRSIDMQGLRSRAPAYRSFTSRTLSPEVIIDVPVKYMQNAAEVPPIITFKWHAQDYVDMDDLSITQDPDSVQWAFVNTAKPAIPGGGANRYSETVKYLRSGAGQPEWKPWAWYGAPGDSGKFWTSPVTDIGTYVFAIRAKDEAGAITPVLDEAKNWRRVRVSQRTGGPVLVVSNEYMGVIRTVSCATPVTIMDSPAGVSLKFNITADAGWYGGEEAGYRYGWDIPDLNDPEGWEISLTPFLPSATVSAATIPPRTFYFGTHTLTIEVVDNSGYCTRVEVKVNIIQFSLERDLLIVDDDTLDDQPTLGLDNGLYPDDAEHDAFWMDMVSEVTGFDHEIDMVEGKVGDIPLTKLAQYKSIIWVVDSDVGAVNPTQLLHQFISHRPKNPPPGAASSGKKVKPNVLALAMAAGGHVMVAGKHPVQLVINRGLARGDKFPVIFVHELEGDQHLPAPVVGEPLVGDLSFAYRDLCLETMDYALMLAQRIRRRNASSERVSYCPIEFIRPVGSNSGRDDTLREAFPLDPNFPTLTLRPEVSGPDDFYAPAARGLDVEVYNPQYFRRNSGRAGACDHVPTTTRPCFQPIYGVGSNDTMEPTYHQPIAFWTSVYADRVAVDVPGAVAARSVVFGFPPVLMTPSEFKPVMDLILFDEWKLPRGANAAASAPQGIPRHRPTDDKN